MKPIRFLPGAEEDAVAASSFYEARLEGLGEEFESALDLVLQGLDPAERHRQVGVDEGRPIRSARFPRRFPHRVIFLELEHEFLVIAIEHPSRRPRYWRGRV